MVCKEAEHKAFMAEQERRENRRTADLFLKWSQIGSHYRDCSFDNFQARPGTESAIRAAKEFLREYDEPNGKWLLLFGPPGSGKTHIAMAMRNEVEQKYGSMALAITQPYLLQQIRASWNRRGGEDVQTRTEDWILDKLQIAKFVLIDDLMEWPEWAEDRIFVFLDGRYRSGKRCVFSSNHTPDALAEILGPRLWSRFAARTEMVRVTAEDYRIAVERPKTVGR